MKPARPGNLPAVRIEAANEWAWCGERRLALTPRAFAVLRHLVEHAGRLITKDELLATVWRDAIVSDAALASCIRDLRRALGDSSERAAVHRNGASAGIPVHRTCPRRRERPRRVRAPRPAGQPPSRRLARGPDAWWAERPSSRSFTRA